jgi:hypothetical protein
VAALSFVWGQLPYLLSARPWSFGADGDSALHFAIQMRLRDPRVFPNDPELDLYMAARPPLEFLIHRTVGWMADVLFRGNLFAANMAGFWTLHLCFIAGNLKLGREALGSLGGAMLFAAASAGASRSLMAWWGMPYSAVVPHSTVAMAMVPWLVWGYLRFGTHRTGRLCVFLALGSAVNLYPLYATYLALMIVAVEAVRGRRRDLPLLALVFALAALPSVATAALRSLSAFGTLAAEERPAVEALFDQSYPYLQGLGAPGTARTLARSPVWWFLAASVLARRLKQRREGLRETDLQLSWMAIAAVALALAGLQLASVHRAFALFLFHRSSALIYIPAYLGCAWLAMSAARTRGLSGRAAAAAVAVLMMSNAGYHTALGYAGRDAWPPQAARPFYELADWARLNIARDRLLLVPPSGKETYYGLRAHAERAVFLHSALGEVVLTNPRAGLRYQGMMSELRPLYTGPDVVEVVRVARKYGASHMLVEAGTGSIPDLPLAFRNRGYLVLAIPRDTP